MDLLGDIGVADQLTSARAENAVLQQKVKELTQKVKELTVKNHALLAEVEMFRKEAALPNISKLALGQATSTDGMEVDHPTPQDFIKSGNGIYPTENAVNLEGLHARANPSCCALHPQDTIIASGGADANLTLCQWGGALSPAPGASESAVQQAVRLSCPAPVICVAFSQQSFGNALPIVAAGCMDGSVRLAKYSTVGSLQAHLLDCSTTIKCAKYIKTLQWCPKAPILAVASADGTVVLAAVANLQDSCCAEVEIKETLHMNGTVESLCFSADGANLIVYTRGTPYLSYINLDKECEISKINLNRAGGTVGGFEDHVSFAVMDMAVSPNGKFLALATDTSRNIIIDAVTGRQIRNLYGHTNDGFSNPKISWSSSGQYIFGNTQEDGSICVWDIASTNIVQRLQGHTNPVRDLFSSYLSDTLVTTSFDKSTKVWLTPM